MFSLHEQMIIDSQHPVIADNDRIRLDNQFKNVCRYVEFRYPPGPCHTILRISAHALNRLIQRIDDTILEWWEGPLEDREHYVELLFELCRTINFVGENKGRRTTKKTRWRNWEFVCGFLGPIRVVKTCYTLRD